MSLKSFCNAFEYRLSMMMKERYEISILENHNPEWLERQDDEIVAMIISLLTLAEVDKKWKPKQPIFKKLKIKNPMI